MPTATLADRHAVRTEAEVAMSGPYGGHNQFTDARHALYAGWVMGLLMTQGIIVLPFIIDGNYTPTVSLVFGGVSVEMRIEYPPDEWELGAT